MKFLEDLKEKKPFDPPVVTFIPSNGVNQGGIVASSFWVLPRSTKAAGTLADDTIDRGALAYSASKEGSVSIIVEDLLPWVISNVKQLNTSKEELDSVRLPMFNKEKFQEEVEGLVDAVERGVYDDFIDPNYKGYAENSILLGINVAVYSSVHVKEEKDFVIRNEDGSITVMKDSFGMVILGLVTGTMVSSETNGNQWKTIPKE